MAGGRPQFKITADIIDQCKAMASAGLTMEQIASNIGCSVSTLMLKKSQYAEFSEAIKDGKAKGIKQVVNTLWNKAVAGDNTCMIFWLKNNAGWMDQQSVKLSGDKENPVHIYIPDNGRDKKAS